MSMKIAPLASIFLHFLQMMQLITPKRQRRMGMLPRFCGDGCMIKQSVISVG